MSTLATVTDAVREQLPAFDTIKKQVATIGTHPAGLTHSQVGHLDAAKTPVPGTVTARQSPNRWRGFAMGQIGGAVGLLAVDYYWRRVGSLSRQQPDNTQAQPRTEEPLKAASRFLYTRLTKRAPQSPELRQTLDQLTRWGFGMLLGGVYGAVRAETGLIDLRGGTTLGGGVYGLANNAIGPLLGLSTTPPALPVKQHALRWSANLVYGLATAATTQLLSRPRRAALLIALGAAGVAYLQSSQREPVIKAFLGDTSPIASVPHQQGLKVAHTVIVNRPPADLYRFWRNLENLPRFMRHLEQVQVLADGRSRWRAKAPLGTTIKWEARIINEVEDELIAWQSLPGSAIGNAGSVRFTSMPGGRGTAVKVTLSYDPPAGQLGATVARLLGEEPHAQVADDLRRFKQAMEAVQIPTSAPQIQVSASA